MDLSSGTARAQLQLTMHRVWSDAPDMAAEHMYVLQGNSMTRSEEPEEHTLAQGMGLQTLSPEVLNSFIGGLVWRITRLTPRRGHRRHEDRHVITVRAGISDVGFIGCGLQSFDLADYRTAIHYLCWQERLSYADA